MHLIFLVTSRSDLLDPQCIRNDAGENYLNKFQACINAVNKYIKNGPNSYGLESLANSQKPGSHVTILKQSSSQIYLVLKKSLRRKNRCVILHLR